MTFSVEQKIIRILWEDFKLKVTYDLTSSSLYLYEIKLLQIHFIVITQLIRTLNFN